MELRQHELDVHSIVPNLEELKPFACLYCDKRFTTRGKCNLHMETHSDVSTTENIFVKKIQQKRNRI